MPSSLWSFRDFDAPIARQERIVPITQSSAERIVGKGKTNDTRLLDYVLNTSSILTHALDPSCLDYLNQLLHHCVYFTYVLEFYII